MPAVKSHEHHLKFSLDPVYRSIKLKKRASKRERSRHTMMVFRLRWLPISRQPPAFGSRASAGSLKQSIESLGHAERSLGCCWQPCNRNILARHRRRRSSRHAPPWCGPFIGSSTVKEVKPASLLTCIEPPKRSVSFCTTASPSPVPPCCHWSALGMR